LQRTHTSFSEVKPEGHVLTQLFLYRFQPLLHLIQVFSFLHLLQFGEQSTHFFSKSCLNVPLGHLSLHSPFIKKNPVLQTISGATLDKSQVRVFLRVVVVHFLVLTKQKSEEQGPCLHLFCSNSSGLLQSSHVFPLSSSEHLLQCLVLHALHVLSLMSPNVPLGQLAMQFPL